MGFFDFLFNNKQSNTEKEKQEETVKEVVKEEIKKTVKVRYDNAEIQVMDLLHLVDTANKKVFSKLIVYYGNNKDRHLKTHLNLKSESEKETNDRYYTSLHNIMKTCYELKPKKGSFNNDYSFVVTGSEKVTNGDLEIIRVYMNFCTPDEEECIEKTNFFDFVMGDKEFLLLDIDNLELYK